MKHFKFILITLLSIFLFSCSKNDKSTHVTDSFTKTKVRDISNNSHNIELYTDTGMLQQGYNAISLRIKDKNTNNYISNASMSWIPMMHMKKMQHSCPVSEITIKSDDTSIYNGFIIFQMPENEIEYWKLTVKYSINGISYTATDHIHVTASSKKNVTTFLGIDGKKYVICFIDPAVPKVTTNPLMIGLYQMENNISFPIVKNHKIQIDPRMPSMGNHGSPNNEDAIYVPNDGLYHGKLSLTMSGYWKINLKVLNENQEIIKGEVITADNESSSLFFEIAF